MTNYNQNRLQVINSEPYPVLGDRQVLRVITLNVGEDKTTVVCLFEDGSQEAVDADVYYGDRSYNDSKIAPSETPPETPPTPLSPTEPTPTSVTN